MNADIAEGGWLKAALLTREGEPMVSFTLDDAIALTGNVTEGRVRWRTRERLMASEGEHFRLLFALKNAKLYSFWID